MKNNKMRLTLVIFTILVLGLIFTLDAKAAFELGASTTSQDTCPGSTVLFTATLKGKGDFTVNIDGKASSWASAVPPGIYLEEGASETIYVYASPPSETQTGVYDLNLKVSGSEGTKTINYLINVVNCHKLDISGETTKTVCSCSQDAYQLSLVNSGSFQEIYNLDIKGPASEFLSLSQKSIMLNPGETKTIPLYAKVSCSTQGAYDFVLSAGNVGVFKEVKGVLNAKDCFAFELKTDKDTLSFCERSINDVPLTIENKADRSNEFRLKITGPAWANLEKESLLIGPSQKAVVNLIINPDYSITGDFDVKVVATENINGKSQEKLFKVKIRDCYGVSVNLPNDPVKICSGFTKTITSEIKNEGEYSQEYKISLSNGWISQQKSNGTLTLSPGAKKNLNLDISPGNDVVPKEYEVTLSVSSTDESKSSSSDTMKVYVLSKSQCYQQTLISEDEITVKKDSSAIVPITIKHDGVEKAKYALTLGGDVVGFSQLNPATFQLEPEKSKISYLYLSPGVNTKAGDYIATISVRLQDGETLSSKNIKVKIIESGSKLTGGVIGQLEGPSLWTKVKAWIKDIFTKDSTENEETPQDFLKETEITKDTTFVFDGKQYEFKIKDKSKDQWTVQVKNIIALMSAGKEKNIDINGDNISDYRLKLTKPKSSTEDSTLTVVRINEKENVEDTESTPFLSWKNVVEHKSSAIGILALIIIILAFIIRKAARDQDEFEEEFKGEDNSNENDGEGIKIGRWILAIILLVVAFVLIRRYWVEILLYKYYFLLGVVGLILIVLGISYWSKIIQFFEEEEEELKNEEPKSEFAQTIIPKVQKDETPVKRKRGRPPKLKR